MNKKQIFFFVDMDGVIADFMDGANALNMSAKEFKLKRGAFLNLKPIVNAFKVLDAIEEQLGFKIQIVTKIPDENPYAATEKLLWLRKNDPKRAVNVTITNNKGIVGEEGDFLTDDRPHKANVESFKGTLIHFGEDGRFPHWKSVAEHFNLNVELE